jgi:hypothetical protein
MGTRAWARAAAAAVALAVGATAARAQAQFQVTLPEASPAATVMQTVGLTDITVTYHRPAVKGRAIWGALVPYGEVWRAGANENTTIAFSTPVTVGGTQLAAGTYGLHLVPTEREWTFILSSVSWAWGSFTYDQKEDVARVAAAPSEAPFAEHLVYTVEMPAKGQALVTLHWDRKQASLPVAIDVDEVVLASMEKQFRGPQQYNWQAWNTAARYCLNNKVALDRGMKWVDRSLAITEAMPNLMTKADLLAAQGEAAQAGALRERALAVGTEPEVNSYGYQLVAAGKVDEAIAVFARNVKDHPGSWNAVDSLAEAYAAKGDAKKAVELYTRARSMAPAAQHKRIDGELARLKPKTSS